MNLFDIMKAQRKSGKPPTLKGRRWNKKERERLSKELCVKCGEAPCQSSSFLCGSCEGETSIEDIRTDIERLRARILRK